MPYSCLLENTKDRIPPANSFYEVNTILVLKLHKDSMKEANKMYLSLRARGVVQGGEYPSSSARP
jgi:hypothetical protein